MLDKKKRTVSLNGPWAFFPRLDCTMIVSVFTHTTGYVMLSHLNRLAGLPTMYTSTNNIVKHNTKETNPTSLSWWSFVPVPRLFRLRVKGPKKQWDCLLSTVQ